MKKPILSSALALFLGFLLIAGCKPPAPDQPAGQAGNTSSASAGEGCSGAAAIDGLTAVPAPAGQSPVDGDRLVRHSGAEPPTLNPITQTDAEASDMLAFVSEGLLDMDLVTGEVKPLLAESWEVSPDNLTFTFRLRRGVKFHNGQPFTADDYIFTMDTIMDPKVDAAPLRAYLNQMDFYQKLDDFTVVVKWKEPYFKALEMVGGVPIVPRSAFKPGEDFNRSPFGRAPIGTGPYRFMEWKTGDRVVLERWPEYWGAKPHLNGIVFKIITDDNVALQVQKNGELDFIPRLMREQWLFQTNGADFVKRFNKIHYPYPSYSWIGWNMRKPLFQDKRVRQSLTLLMDRDLMLKEIFKCMGTVASGPFYYRTELSDPAVKPWPFDPARAKALLAEAGWKDANGDGVLEKDGQDFRFELSFTVQVPEWERMAVIYKEELKKAGIDMVIRKLEWAVFSQNVQEWKFDACAMAWALEAHSDLYPLFHSSQANEPGSQNYVGYQNSEVDRLIEMNRSEFDPQKRVEYGRQLHRLIHEDQPYTFFLSGERLATISSRFVNIHPKPLRPCFKFDEWYAAEQKYKAAPGP